MMVTDREYAVALDEKDPLKGFKSLFMISDPDMCYLDGNSLGRLPLATVTAVNDFMTREWGPEVVTGWGHWVDEAQPTGDLLGRATLGAAAGQVLVCDTTSVNFYQLALAAIQARPGRKTIITDAVKELQSSLGSSSSSSIMKLQEAPRTNASPLRFYRST
jgi:kynureninase